MDYMELLIIANDAIQDSRYYSDTAVYLAKAVIDLLTKEQAHAREIEEIKADIQKFREETFKEFKEDIVKDIRNYFNKLRKEEKYVDIEREIEDCVLKS